MARAVRVFPGPICRRWRSPCPRQIQVDAERYGAPRSPRPSAAMDRPRTDRSGATFTGSAVSESQSPIRSMPPAVATIDRRRQQQRCRIAARGLRFSYSIAAPVRRARLMPSPRNESPAMLINAKAKSSKA